MIVLSIGTFTFEDERGKIKEPYNQRNEDQFN
jgi:hypothetical protein